MPQYEPDRSTISELMKDNKPLTSLDKLNMKYMPQAMAVAGGLAPLAAHAEATPSLVNLLKSVAAGGFVLAAIAGAVVTVANFDPVDRA